MYTKEITLESFIRTLGLEGNTKEYFSANWEMLREKLAHETRIPENFTRGFYEKRKALFHSPAGKDLLERIFTILPILEGIPECWFFARAYGFMDHKVIAPIPSGELAVHMPVLGENTPVFFWMVKAGLVPLLEDLYKKENIPSSMAEAALETLIGVAEMYVKKDASGVPGCILGIPSWERQYAAKQLFRIGRLVYKPMENPWYMPYIYRHKTTGKLAVFARDSWLLDEKSRMPFIREAPEGFTRTWIRQEKDTITGFAIDPWGKCDLSAPRTIARAEYEELLTTSSLVGDMHIPAGAPFSPELILDSMVRAKDFLESYLRRPIALFACNSWLLNPAWERLIPHSNIACFQKEGYLFPGDCCDVEGLGNVFGKVISDRSAYPRNTSLEKAFHQLFQEGERLRSGGIFFLPEDLAFYGSSHYRK